MVDLRASDGTLLNSLELKMSGGAVEGSRPRAADGTFLKSLELKVSKGAAKGGGPGSCRWHSTELPVVRGEWRGGGGWWT